MTNVATAAAFSFESFVESDTIEGAFYLVALHPGRAPHCTCPAFLYRTGPLDDERRQLCKHLVAEGARRERLRVWLQRERVGASEQVPA